MHRFGPRCGAIGGRHGHFALHTRIEGLHLARDHFFRHFLRVSHKGRDGDWKGLGGSDDVFEGSGGMVDASNSGAV